MGIADLLYLGQPDPARQLAALLAGRTQQPPQGPAPAPPGPVDPNAPAPAAQPVSAGQNAAPNPAPGAPPPPGSPPQPAVLQSTPDMSASYAQLANPPNLMSLYLQLDARNRASQQINSGLALIAANHSAPGMREAIMQSVSGGADAGGTVNNLMSLYQGQQQMAAQQQMLAQAPAIAAKLGMDEGTVRAEIMAGRGPDLIKSLEPTTEAKNYQWAHDTYAKNHPGASPAEIDAGAQSILLGAGGGGGGEMAAMNIARSRWLADPNNQGKPPPGYMTDLSKWKIYSQDTSDAKQQFNGMNDSLGFFINGMSEVANDKNLDSVAGHPLSGGAAASWPTSEAAQLYKKMEGLAGTSKDLGSRGGPKGVGQNLRTLGSNPDDFKDLSYTDYRGDVIAPRMRQALTAQANAFGASGQANASSMPGYLQHYMDQMYKAGGELDIGGSPRATSPDTGPDGKPLKQPDAAALRDFYTALEHRGPQYALNGLKNAGYDTSALR